MANIEKRKIIRRALSATVPTDIFDAIQEYAQREERTVSQIVSMALRAYLPLKKNGDGRYVLLEDHH